MKQLIWYQNNWQ